MTTDTPTDAPARRALLIGVEEVPQAQEAFPSLREAVRADLKALGEALEGSGYEVERCEGEKSTLMGILTAIEHVGREVPAGGTLLLAFSGHGVTLGGTDYLVPSDALAPEGDRWSPARRRGLIEIEGDIGLALADTRAETVVWAVDACRQAVPGADEVPNHGFATRMGVRPGLKRAVLVGCSPGERCVATPDGSFFSRVLADALHPYSPQETLEEVYKRLRDQVPLLAMRAGHGAQHPLVDYGPNADNETSAARICQGQRLSEEWSAATREAALWQAAADTDPELVAQLQSCLAALAEECAAVVHKAHARQDDPWADADFPVRLLRRCLPQLLPGGRQLTAHEVAALIAAPFLHEAAWADQLSRSVELSVLDTGHRKGADPARRHWEQLRDQHTQVARKLRGLAEDPERNEDARAVALWLTHRWIADYLGTGGGTVANELAKGFAAKLAGVGRTPPNADRLAEETAALLRLAEAIGPEGLEEDEEDNADRMGLRSTGGMRQRPLAGLLHLAAVLAADVRTLPEVIADHLAVADPLRPADALDAVRSALTWQSDDRRELHLDMPCPHPAVHAAMQEKVSAADKTAALLRGWATHRLTKDEGALLEAVPARVTDRDLRPGADRGPRPGGATAGKAYDVPLLRFQLSQTEIRDLLMGRELYGRPELAFRELFQNAMDACRYREMRHRYLELRGSPQHGWEGRISIVQGEDERGRYVECRDNGVGMGREQLQSTFTQAGRRFVHARAFRREQSQWLRQDSSLQLYPNSRFGIGVLSYFMLADEMTLVTRQVDTEGRPGPNALRVDIASSGSLFRIRRQEEAAGEDTRSKGGTRVRLYLRNEEDLAGLSCTKTLRELVAVSEFALKTDDGRVTAVWEPKQLYLAKRGLHESAKEAVPHTLWWVGGQGAVLCDGVMTDQRPHGYVLNLTGEHAGELSVDRTRLQAYDEEWAAKLLRTGAQCLPEWQGLTMDWLWDMEENGLWALRTIWDALIGRGLRIPVDRWDSHGKAELDTLGCFGLDSRVRGFSPRYSTTDMRSNRLLAFPWRTKLLEGSNAMFAPYAPVSLKGFDVARPGDALLVEAAGGDWRTALLAFDKAKIPIHDGLVRMRKLRPLGPTLAPPPVFATPPSGHLSDAETLLLGALIRPRDKREELRNKRRQSWKSDTAPNEFVGLVSASEHTGRALGELVRALGRFTPFLAGDPPPVPPELADYVCIHGERSALTDWLHGMLGGSPLQLDQRDWKPSHAALAEWLRHDSPRPYVCIPFADVDEAALRNRLRGRLLWTGDSAFRLHPDAVVEHAARQQIPLGQAAEKLAALCREAGVDLTDPCREHGLRTDWIPSRRMAEFYPGWEPDDSRNAHFIAHRLETESEDALQAFEELEAAGYPLPTAWRTLADWARMPQRSQQVLGYLTDAYTKGYSPVAHPTEASLFMAACGLVEPLGQIWEFALAEREDLRSAIAPLPRALSGFAPSAAESRCLLEFARAKSDERTDESLLSIIAPDEAHRFSRADEPPEWAPLTAFRLVCYAHERGFSPAQAYARLAPLRALGAKVPLLAEDQLAAMPSAVPDGLDALALADTYRVSPSGEPYSALDLVSIAARLGEPVDATWRRMEKYACLGVGTDVPHLPDVLPLWQDLAILSVRLDGMPPAVSGTVGAAHIAFAAEGVEEDPSRVRERLALYAAMFELEVTGDDA